MEAAIDAGAAASANETVVSDAASAAENTATSAAPEPEKSVSIDDTLSKAYENINRPRGPDGKFAPKNAALEIEAEQPAEAEALAEEIKADQPEESVVEQAKPAIDAPLSWSAEMKAKFATLPPDVQQYVAQRDKETHDAITRNGLDKKALEERVKSYEPFDQLVQHYAPDFQRRGISAPQAFAVLLDAQTKLDANPHAALIQIADHYGINLRPAFQDLAQAQSLGVTTPPGPSPEVHALRNELAQIKSHLTEQERQRFEAATAAEQSERTALQSQIAEFSKDKPHFAAVREIMGKLVLTGEAATLDEAYDKATWAHPEIRQRILTDQRKAEEDRRRAEAAKKTADAKKSAAVNVTSGTGTKAPRTWTETIESEAARLFGT